MPAVVISNLYRNLFGVSRSNALWLFIFLEELQMNIEKIKLAMFAAILTTGLTACEKPGPAEKAGKEIDQAMAEASSKMSEASEKLSEQAVNVSKVLDDASITAKVVADILADPDLKHLEIHVETTGKVVTLTGLVDSQDNSDKAEKIAAAVTDVKEVDNKLNVKSPS